MADRTPTITIMRRAADDPIDPGGDVVVQEGESCDVTAVFKDNSGTAIAKAALITLTASLYDLLTNASINSRLAQSVLDANQGAVATDGTLTLRLGPLDNVIVGTTLATGKTETHCLQLNWTWNDGVSVRTGKSEPLGIKVEQLPTVT